MGVRKKRPAPKRMPAQTTGESTGKPTLIPQAHGGALNSGGTPGNKGGRPPNWLKDWCDDLLHREENKQQVEEILKDSKHPAYAQMWRAVADRAHGKPVQAVVETGEKVLTVRIVHE